MADWKKLPAGSKERYEAAKKDPSVQVGPFMGGDYMIRPKTATKRNASKGYSAPWFGDAPPSAKNIKSYAEKTAAKRAAIDKIAKSKKMGK